MFALSVSIFGRVTPFHSHASFDDAIAFASALGLHGCECVIFDMSAPIADETSVFRFCLFNPYAITAYVIE